MINFNGVFVFQTGDTRSVKQFHYMLWPDFGVPSTPETFLNFLYDIRESGVFDTDQAPPVIHCRWSENQKEVYYHLLYQVH